MSVITIGDMKRPAKGLHFGEIIIYDAAHDYSSSRIPVIRADGTEGWYKHSYIDEIGGIESTVRKIVLEKGNHITWSNSRGGTANGVFVGIDEDGHIILSEDRP